MIAKLRGDRSARVGVVLVAILMVMVVVGPSLAPHDPLEVTTDRLAGASWTHPLGTDGLGRDVFSRLLVGARLSLGTALLAAALVSMIGVAVGTLAGFSGGAVDGVLMRLVDVVLAVPALILALAVSGLFPPSLLAVMLGLVTIWWAGYARVVRGLVLSIRERPFVEAARAAGATERRIMVRHVLPNVVSPVIVLATLEIGQLILAVAALTFLGLGAPPPTPEWGAMLNDGRTYFLSDPQLVLIPGLAICLAVLGFNLLGDGIRDALDPRLVAPASTIARITRRGEELVALHQAGRVRTLFPRSGNEELDSVRLLQAMSQHWPRLAFSSTPRRTSTTQSGPDPEDVAVEGGVMDLAQSEAVGHDRIPAFVPVREDVGGVEELGLAKPAHRA